LLDQTKIVVYVYETVDDTENEQKQNTAIVDSALRPRSVLPSPPSRPIGRIACAQNFPDFYLRLPGIMLHDVIGDRMIPFAANALQCIVSGEETPKIALPLGFSSPCLRRSEPRP